jgi:predicted HAD superfamily phosphohydrolase YqeG
MAAMGTTCSETAVLGDQIFTDILAGKRLGLHCILVKPINDKKTPFFIIKRLLEKPFIYIYNYRKQMRHK